VGNNNHRNSSGLSFYFALLNLLRADRRTDVVKRTDDYCSFLLRECQEIKIYIKSMQQRPLRKPNSSSGNQEIAAFHVTQSSVTMSTKACDLSLSCAR